MARPVLPLLSDPLEHHADWLEWNAIAHRRSFASWADHQRDLGLAGGDESLDGYEDEAAFESLIDDVACELEDRARACSAQCYPFTTQDGGLLYRRPAQYGLYEFLLGLSVFERDAWPQELRAERLFEEICGEALRAYLGPNAPSVEVICFGFPRRDQPKGFREAVDAFCEKLGEGHGCSETPGFADQKDGKLDLVGWQDFPDRRPGKLILFGQCSTGLNWFDKIHDLRAEAWCKTWLKRTPLVTPVESFFLPRCVERDKWEQASRYGGILFDRCRISALLPNIASDLADRLAEYTVAMVQEE